MRPLSFVRAAWNRRAEKPVDPARYWERRARDLVDGYDHPETWDERGWLSGGIEEKVVPQLLRRHGVRSVLVVGAGTGRQYEFLAPLGVPVRGFDISPTLARAARERHPGIDTTVDDLLGADERHSPADAVLATAVLQHVAPGQVADAARAMKALAYRLIVLRELTWLAPVSSYQWAHDYDALFSDWQTVDRVVTDANAVCRVELRALAREAPGDRTAAIDKRR